MPGPVDIDVATPPSEIKEFNQTWIDWLASFQRRFPNGPLLVKALTVAELPAAGAWSDGDTFSAIVLVTDETGGATLAYSDGTDWRRVQDRAIVS